MNLIVGIGAAAGGPPALASFLKALPSTTGCSFVVIPGASLTEKTGWEKMLARHTSMPVCRAAEGMLLASDTLYVVPSSAFLVVRENTFQRAATADGQPVNVFLDALAAEAGPRSVAIILSGEGDDGAAGLGLVHGAGGLVMVQRATSAGSPSMPRHAIATEMADHVLLPEKMPAAILAHRHRLQAIETRFKSTIAELQARNAKLTDSHRELSRAIDELQERFNIAISSSRIAWWEWDVVSGSVTGHGGLQSFLGYQAEDLPSTSTAWFALMHPEDLPTFRSRLEECIAGATDEWSCEHRFKTAQGGWRWVLTGGKVARRASNRQALRILGTTQDIHGRKTAEETVYRDAKLFSKIPHAVICTDLGGIITYWNEGATQLYGWTPGEVIGTSNFDRYPASEHQKMRQNLRIILSGRELHRERHDMRKDGSRVWVESHVSLFNDARGQPAGIIAISFDISERKAAEAARQHLELQLFQTQKMETLGTLAGGIAHDFNNILTAILGYTQLSLEIIPPLDPVGVNLEAIMQASLRARDLVQRILSFSRLHEPERTRVNLKALIEDVSKMIRATLPATIEIILDLPEQPVATLADPNQLHQVLLNLCSNAAHAMRQRTGRLLLRLRPLELTEVRTTTVGALPPGRYFTIQITDEGCGMDEETIKRIFDPFFTTKEVGEGTGLGLSVVHGIMQGHGGSIDVRSTPGQGSTFIIYVPALSTKGFADSDAHAESGTLFPGQGERIFVIDDERDIAVLTTEAMRNFGYDAVYFPSPEKALQILEKDPAACRLLITDQTMPHLTGLELIQKLRAAGHSLPVIITSGFSRMLNQDVLARLGQASLLSKPYDLRKLATLVHEMLAAAPAHD